VPGLRGTGQRLPLKCAHTADEAAEALGQEETLPDLVVLDLHFALPEAQLLPRNKDGLDLETVRRTQGLYILAQLRKDYPTLPVVLLTTTDASIERPQHPLVHFCENEVVDSRTLAAEVSRALALQHAAQEGPVFWDVPRPWPSCAARSRSWLGARCQC